MTQLRKGAFIRKVKDITLSSALALTVLSAGLSSTSCSSKTEEQDAYSYEETTYSKGVLSRITEIKPGEFKIMDEESVPVDKAGAIVTYLDGHSDSLSVAASKALIDEEIRSNPSGVGAHSGLSNMLLYGGIGYMLARNMNGGQINNFRNRDGGAATRGVYGNTGAYARAQTAVGDVNSSRSTRVVNSRPSGGRSGFFGSSRSNSGG